MWFALGPKDSYGGLEEFSPTEEGRSEAEPRKARPEGKRP